jgi:hypothetical protein
LPSKLDMVATYLVAFGAMTFAALSALTLIFAVNHFDPPAASEPERRRDKVAA